jgi:hypothetical protein
MNRAESSFGKRLGNNFSNKFLNKPAVFVYNGQFFSVPSWYAEQLSLGHSNHESGMTMKTKTEREPDAIQVSVRGYEDGTTGKRIEGALDRIGFAIKFRADGIETHITPCIELEITDPDEIRAAIYDATVTKPAIVAVQCYREINEPEKPHPALAVFKE